MSGVDTVHAAVLALDLGLAQHGLDTALRFATLAEPMRDLMRLMRTDAVRGKLPEATLRAWIDSVAHALPAEDAGGRMTGSTMNTVRRNPILSALFSQMKDSLGTWSHTGKLGKDRLADAALRLMRAPETLAREVAEASPFMAGRLKDQMAEMRDAGRQALVDEAPGSKGHEAFLAAGQRYAFDLTAWTAAYSKAVESGTTDPVAKADAVVAGPPPKTNVDASLGALLTSFAGYFPKNGNSAITGHPETAQILYWLGTLNPALSAARLPENANLRPWLTTSTSGPLPSLPTVQTTAKSVEPPAEPKSLKGIQDPAVLATALTGIPDTVAAPLHDWLTAGEASEAHFLIRPEGWEATKGPESKAYSQRARNASPDNSTTINSKGGKSPPQIQLNQASGAAFQDRVGKYAADTLDNFVQEVSIRPNTSTGSASFKIRIDGLGSNPETQAIALLEAKGSATAPLTPNQTKGFPLVEQYGGIIVGTKGGANYPAGTAISPKTGVRIIRPDDLPDGY